MRLWDAETGQPVGDPLSGRNSYVASVAFSPDGKRIVSGSIDGTIRVWPVPEPSPEALCAKLTRNMSLAEWEDWVSPDIDFVELCLACQHRPTT